MLSGGKKLEAGRITAESWRALCLFAISADRNSELRAAIDDTMLDRFFLDFNVVRRRRKNAPTIPAQREKSRTPKRPAGGEDAAQEGNRPAKRPNPGGADRRK